MNTYWIALASNEHVQVGKAGNFACVTHGKKQPLEKMHPQDGIIYYSPTELFGDNKPLRQFTALCLVNDTPPFQKEELFNGFSPWAREVTYTDAQPVSIKALLADLSFVKNKKHWGMYFRRGVFSIPKADFILIASKMGVTLP